MRFPRLSSFFQRHRRVKSDPDVHRLASAPLASPEARPVSSACILDLNLPPLSSSDIFTSYGSYITGAAPFAFPLPPTALSVSGPPGPSVVHPSTSSTLNYRSSADPVEHSSDVFALLTERIQDLENALVEECEANTLHVSALEDALKAERRAREAAEQANRALSEKMAMLQTEVIQLRRVLFSCVTRGTSNPATTEVPSASPSGALVRSSSGTSVHSQHTAGIVTERDRLKRFVELLISAGAHKPVLDLAYQQILQGSDAELALVQSIKRAVTQQDSVWRQLLEPVTGVRTQEEYLAQLRCTLDARRQTTDWRKRATFWKRTAKAGDACGADVITPSVSQMSDVTEALDPERQKRVQEMMEQLKRGELPLRVAYTTRTATDQEHQQANDQDVHITDPLSTSPSAAQSDVEAIVQMQTLVSESESASPIDSIPAASSSMVLPVLASTGLSTADSASTARIPPTYSNLPPLASETFRASHSIKSIQSARVLRLESLASSTSVSSQASSKSRRKRTRTLQGSRETTEPSISLPTTSESDEPAEPTIFVASPSGSAQIQPELGEPLTSTSGEQPSQERPVPSSSLPRALVDFGRGSDEDLVLVLNTDFSETSYRASPPRPSGSSTSTIESTASSTPEKENDVEERDKEKEKKTSRLPVRMPGLNAIRRLSASIAMSRDPRTPLTTSPLDEVTNASPAGPQPVSLEEDLKTAVQEPKGAESRARAKSTSALRGPGGAPEGAGGEQTLKTKIPMGRRLQRFGIGNGGERR